MNIFISKLNKKTGRALASALILSVSLIPAAVSAADLDKRLNTLENEVQTLNRAYYQSQATLDSLQINADAQSNMQKFDGELRQLQGQIEEAGHETRMLKREIDNLKEDFNLRFQEVEKRLQAQDKAIQSKQRRQLQAVSTPSQLNVGTNPVAQPATLPSIQTTVKKPAYLPPVDEGNKGSALLEYEAAFNLIKQAKYNQAQLGFEVFLANHPQHQLSSNAKYWLGETHYVRGDHKQAARVFAEGFQAYPKGAKAPDNLLKLGLSLNAMGKKDDACVALKQVSKEFPTGASSVTSRAEKELEAIGCQ